MVISHIGNNVYLGRSIIGGDNRTDLESIQNCVYIDIDTGIISRYGDGQWYTVTNNTKSDQLVFITESQQTKTNIGTTYVDIFPASINGNPIPIDTTGFTKIGYQLFWNKNAGSSNHDFRIINNADDTKVLLEVTNISATITENFNNTLPNDFINFIGKLRIQGKATNATDDPIFLGLRLYLRR